MSPTRRGRTFLTLMVTALVAAMPHLATAHSTLVVAQDGFGSPTDCDAATPTPYTTIGSAVAAAAAGDLVKVCPGVYNEQVTITKALTLRGENGVLIKPEPMVANTTSLTTGSPLAVVILVDGANGVTVERLMISGAGNGLACTPSLFGIFYRNASGTIRDTAVRNVRPRLGPCGQSGTGIFVQSGGGGTSRVTLEGNSIHGYQKNGLTANEAGTEITMRKRNVVTGLGPITEAVQNGIQLAFGATGVIEDNIVTDNVSTECVSVDVCPANANDVIVFLSTGVRVSDNVLGRSQTGVYVEGDGNVVTHNVIYDMNVFDGVAVFGDHNEIRDNDITRSAEAAIFIEGDDNKVEGNRINEAPFGILKSGAGNTFDHNRFFNTLIPDPPAPPGGSRAAPQR